MFEEAFRRISENLEAWKNGLDNPPEAQASTLSSFLEDYNRTDYGEMCNAESQEEYKRNYPVKKYSDFSLWLSKVKKGEWGSFLIEQPVTWVMTRGTTGSSKFIPVTERHLNHIIRGGSRAILNHVTSDGSLSALMGGVLNLQFPSNYQKMKVQGEEIEYGFSSGTYAKLNPMLAGLQLIPRQEEIDSLNTGLSLDDWKRRYEYIYSRTRDEEIFTLMGVAPIQTGFASYLKKEHGVYPKDVWDIEVIFSTSVPKIQTKYKKMLQRMYGDVPVVEMYTATEGAFGQQKDDFPYFMPNYDLYYFEVKSGNKMKKLHELVRGQWGRLIVSTPILPRYEIGDLIECMGKNYFRVFGRDKPLTRVEHQVYRLLFGWFI
jgi:hypothetical protein